MAGRGKKSGCFPEIFTGAGMAETLPAKPIDLAELGARAADFARTSRSAATERSYRSDWANSAMWCLNSGASCCMGGRGG